MARAQLLMPGLMPGKKGAFTPLKLPLLRIWLDASQITGLADGADVTTWLDMSGNGRNFTQAVAGAKPHYTLNILNGKPVVRFDGIDDILSDSLNPIMAEPVSIIMVAKHRSGDAVGRECFFGGLKSDFSGTSYLLFSDHGLPENFMIFAGGTITGPNLDANWHIHSALFNVAAATYRVDGAVTNGNVGNQNVTLFGIGGCYDAASGIWWSDIDVAEFILTYSALSTLQFQQVESYLQAKYAL